MARTTAEPTSGRAPADSSSSSDLGEANRQFYDRETPGRDDYWRYMAAPRFRVETLLRHLGREPAASVVDLGCGNGALLAAIGSRFPRLERVGVDLAPRQVERNRLRHPEVLWVVADLDRPHVVPTELRDRFDVVVASEVIEHVQSPACLLANAGALARPGARLLLSTQSGRMRETERRVGHRRHFAAAELATLLEESGWMPERVWNCGFPFHDLSKWYANRNPDRSMARFGERRYRLRERLVAALLRGLFRLNSRRRGAQLFAVGRRATGPGAAQGGSVGGSRGPSGSR